jgi:DNA invertase Pin-like site-specific DNA recombinase
MRSDMAKVIVERPRRGMRQKCAKGYKKALQKLAPEDWQKRESIFAQKGHT